MAFNLLLKHKLALVKAFFEGNGVPHYSILEYMLNRYPYATHMPSLGEIG